MKRLIKKNGTYISVNVTQEKTGRDARKWVARTDELQGVIADTPEEACDELAGVFDRPYILKLTTTDDSSETKVVFGDELAKSLVGY